MLYSTLRIRQHMREEYSILVRNGVNMRLIWILAIPLTLAAQTVPDSILGLYKKAPGDTVRVTRQKDGKAKVETRLVFGGGQSCVMEGEAVWKNNVLTLQADGLDDAKPCRLEMRFAGSKVTLSDPDNLCRPVYCGSAGTFQGAALTKSAAASKPPAKSVSPKPAPKK